MADESNEIPVEETPAVAKEPEDMKMEELLAETKARGLNTDLKKADLVAQLKEARAAGGSPAEDAESEPAAEETPVGEEVVPSVSEASAEETPAEAPASETPAETSAEVPAEETPAGEPAAPEAEPELVAPEAPGEVASAEEPAPSFACEVEECGQVFASSFELSQHMAAEHSVAPADSGAVGEVLPPVVIKTTRAIEVSVAGVAGMLTGTEIEVPYNQAGDVKRRLIEAYGPDILAE